MIFVSTCGYNERFVRETLQSAYDMAAKPDRVSFGIFNQKSSGVPMDDLSDFKNARVMSVVYDEPVGMGTARLNSALLYQGEKYFCQIDSHTVFAQDWDARLIEAHNDLTKLTDKPVIAQSLVWHSPAEQMQPQSGAIWHLESDRPRPLRFVEEHGRIVDDSSRDNEERLLGRFLEHYILPGCGFFALGEVAAEILPPPFMYGYLEQELQSLRYWTRGCRFFSTDEHYFSTMTKSKDGKFNEEEFPNDFHMFKELRARNARLAWEHLTARRLGMYSAPDIESYEDYVKASGFDFRKGQYGAIKQ